MMKREGECDEGLPENPCVWRGRGGDGGGFLVWHTNANILGMHFRKLALI